MLWGSGLEAKVTIEDRPLLQAGWHRPTTGSPDATMTLIGITAAQTSANNDRMDAQPGEGFADAHPLLDRPVTVPAGWLNVQQAAARLRQAKVPSPGPKGT